VPPHRANPSSRACSPTIPCLTSSLVTAGRVPARSPGSRIGSWTTGTHLVGGAIHPQRGRIRQPAALLVQGHPGPQDRQTAARHRYFAAQHPGRGRPSAPACVQDLANITLFSDGTTCTNARRPRKWSTCCKRQGVFGIAVSGAMRELTGVIADFHGERADGGESIARAGGRAGLAAQAPRPQDRLTGRVNWATHRSRAESSVAASHGRRRSNTSPSTSQAPGPQG